MHHENKQLNHFLSTWKYLCLVGEILPHNFPACLFRALWAGPYGALKAWLYRALYGSIGTAPAPVGVWTAAFDTEMFILVSFLRLRKESCEIVDEK